MSRTASSGPCLLLLLFSAAMYIAHTAPTAPVRMPYPWLTYKQDNVLKIECQAPDSLLEQQLWKSVEKMELKFLDPGSARNVTKVSVTSAFELERGEHLHPLASVQVYDHSSGPSRLTVVMPYSESDYGTYFCETQYTDSGEALKTASYHIKVGNGTLGTEHAETSEGYSLETFPVHQVRVTWLPLQSELKNLHVTRISSIPLPLNTTIYSMADPSSSDIKLFQYLKPRDTPCGAQNHTLFVFVSSKLCYLMPCIYTCRVWYPECADGGNGQFCLCGTPPPENLDLNVTALNCDDTTTTPTSISSISTPSSAETSQTSGYTSTTSPTDKLITPRSLSNADGESECRDICIVYRAVATGLSISVGGILMLIISLVIVRLYRRRPRNIRTGHRPISLSSDSGCSTTSGQSEPVNPPGSERIGLLCFKPLAGTGNEKQSHNRTS